MKRINNKNWIVYKHTFPNGKVYIGITSRSVKIRWGLKGNNYSKAQPLIYNAIKKYGWENIEHKILFDSLNEVSAKEIEKDLIFYYKNLGLSYNITDGGDGITGLKMSDESKKKISEKAKKRVGELNSFFGKHHTDETKEKIRNGNIGKKSEFKGKHHTEKVKQYFSDLYKGKSCGGHEVKPVSQYTVDDVWVRDFDCIGDAARFIGCPTTHICAVCKGKNKTARGYKWKYKQTA